VRLYHIGTVVLGMTQAEFWRTTFRKLRALYLCHLEQRGGMRTRAAIPFDDLT
jgi:hypothetical protein